MGRFSHRIYTAYTTFFILGLLLSMQIPFVGFQPVRTSEHMASAGIVYNRLIAYFSFLIRNCILKVFVIEYPNKIWVWPNIYLLIAGVFALLNAVAFLKYLQRFLSKQEFRHFFMIATIIAAAVVFVTVVGLTYAGVIAPWSGRFYSLWDTGYAKIHIPIIASVSEHQPTTWFSLFFDLHILVCTFPVGIWFCIKKINDERVFSKFRFNTNLLHISNTNNWLTTCLFTFLVVLYALFASYFAGVMVRLILTLTPVVCILSAIAFSSMFELYLKDDENPRGDQSGKNDNMYDEVRMKIKVTLWQCHERIHYVNENCEIHDSLRVVHSQLVIVFYDYRMLTN